LIQEFVERERQEQIEREAKLEERRIAREAIARSKVLKAKQQE
jgi:hypothetical protein